MAIHVSKISGISGYLTTLNALPAALTNRQPVSAPGLLKGMPSTSRTCSWWPSSSNGTDTGGNYQVRSYVFVDSVGFRMYYTNNQTTPITVTAALWLRSNGGGNPILPLQATWGGAASIVIPPGRSVESDQIMVPVSYVQGTARGYVAAGDYVYFRTYVTATSGNKWPLGLIPSPNQQEGSSHSASETDETQATSATLAALGTGTANTGQWTNSGVTPPDQSGYVYGPSVVTSISPLAALASPRYAVGVYGDSIGQGSGDTYEAGGFTGYNRTYTSANAAIQGAGEFVRAFDGLKIGYVQGCKYGDQMVAQPIDDNYRLPFYAGCSHVVIQMGVNNITTYTDGASDVNVAANVTSFLGLLQGMMAHIQRRVPKIILCTYLPITNAAGNTPTTCNHTRIAINNYIRANWASLGASGYLDRAAAVEADTATQSALISLQTGLTVGTGIYSATALQQPLTAGGGWLKPGGTNLYTADGTHPSQYGHTALAAAHTSAIGAGLLAQ
ncbi:hypothetical protein CCAX7_53930 [Capsulimonas corticalis]|uniref:Uncharacterized protein n=1 Tax=Capsulimonas corticalis TaxID=2219043 RepID=A0A402CNQ3_9BACT|nr:SGNH/GDSL hydrolase family protein [Capsulimonas corticalis]BDI33342.1 hypothetical protein CCAX7_53930 [Capsulimonas corticalis]